MDINVTNRFFNINEFLFLNSANADLFLRIIRSMRSLLILMHKYLYFGKILVINLSSSKQWARDYWQVQLRSTYLS
jgi:hypothetical protein